MSLALNRVIIGGYMARDLEIRYTPGGMAVGSVAVGVNREWTDQNSGDKKSEAVFVDVTIWGKQAENVAQYLKQGSPIIVEGRLSQDSWEDKETGKKRYKMFVTAERVQFVGNGGNGEGDEKPRGKSTRKEDAPAPKGKSAPKRTKHERDPDWNVE